MEYEGKVNYQNGGKGMDPKQLIETRTLKFRKLLEELTFAKSNRNFEIWQILISHGIQL